MCISNVRDWLVLLTMEGYLDKFKESGYITLDQCKQIMYSDLIMLGIENMSHRQLLLEGVQLLKNSKEFKICPEPCRLHDSHAIHAFDTSMALKIEDFYPPLLSPVTIHKLKSIAAGNDGSKTETRDYTDLLSPPVSRKMKTEEEDNDENSVPNNYIDLLSPPVSRKIKASLAINDDFKDYIDLLSPPVVRKIKFGVPEEDSFKTMTMTKDDYGDLFLSPIAYNNNQVDVNYQPVSPIISLKSPPLDKKNIPTNTDDNDDIFKFEDDFFIYAEPDFDLLCDLLSSSG